MRNREALLDILNRLLLLALDFGLRNYRVLCRWLKIGLEVILLDAFLARGGADGAVVFD